MRPIYCSSWSVRTCEAVKYILYLSKRVVITIMLKQNGAFPALKLLWFALFCGKYRVTITLIYFFINLLKFCIKIIWSTDQENKVLSFLKIYQSPARAEWTQPSPVHGSWAGFFVWRTVCGTKNCKANPSTARGLLRSARSVTFICFAYKEGAGLGLGLQPLILQTGHQKAQPTTRGQRWAEFTIGLYMKILKYTIVAFL